MSGLLPTANQNAWPRPNESRDWSVADLVALNTTRKQRPFWGRRGRTTAGIHCAAWTPATGKWSRAFRSDGPRVRVPPPSASSPVGGWRRWCNPTSSSPNPIQTDSFNIISYTKLYPPHPTPPPSVLIVNELMNHRLDESTMSVKLKLNWNDGSINGSGGIVRLWNLIQMRGKSSNCSSNKAVN